MPSIIQDRMVGPLMHNHTEANLGAILDSRYVGLTGDQTVAGIKTFSGTSTFSKSIALPYVAKTADYTLTDSDYTCAVTASSVNITITLPAVSGTTGRVYNIKKMDSTAYTVIIDGNASETIDGDTTQILSSQYDNLQIQSTGRAWLIL